MSGKLLFCQWLEAKIERPDTVLETLSGPNHSEPFTEAQTMADYGQYTDSARADNPEQSSNWKSIGELAKRLAEKQAGGK